MRFLKILLNTSLVLLCLFGHTQPVTQVQIDLKVINDDYLSVKVMPPVPDQDQWTFIIPEIIPGTYMKINNERFYKKIKAFDKQGNDLKVKRKDNYIYIDGKGKPLDHITYQVRQALGANRVWDNMIACGGTVFTEDGFLLNAQMLSGYFDGYENSPFEVIFTKYDPLFGATSMKNKSRSENKDVFYAENYGAWVDQPVLYGLADTTSFEIDGKKFIVAVRAELGKTQSKNVAPAVQTVMQSIHDYSGFNHEGEYYFLLYHVDYERLKGLFKSFGVGGALEHKNSSMYVFTDAVYDSTYKYLHHILAHEYFHTITPLNLHSEKIRNFRFAEPDMSRHVWLYEGTTDYFAHLSNEVNGINQDPFIEELGYSITFAEKRKERSLTESGRNIIKKNMVSWVGKMIQLMNFYSIGKVIAFTMDVELLENDSEKRWIDVVMEMKEEFAEQPFDDRDFREVLVRYTNEEVGDIYQKYVENGDRIPYDKYLGKLGWKYLAEKTKIPAYSKKWIVPFHFDSKKFFVHKIGKNTLGIQQGDTLVSINGVETTLENRKSNPSLFTQLYYPEDESEDITLKVKRGGKILTLSGRASLKRKSPVAKVIPVKNPTKEQLAFQKAFFER